MDTNVLEVIACPLCKGELIFDRTHQELICRFDRLAYSIHNNIPMLLAKFARSLEEEEIYSSSSLR